MDDEKSSGRWLYTYNKAIRTLGTINRTITYKNIGKVTHRILY